jgi:Domain of unknown function (DUF1707)
MGERRKQETAASYGAEIKRVLEQPDEEVWRFYPVGDGSRCEIRPARHSPRCTAEGAVMKTLPGFTSGGGGGGCGTVDGKTAVSYWSQGKDGVIGVAAFNADLAPLTLSLVQDALEGKALTPSPAPARVPEPAQRVGDPERDVVLKVLDSGFASGYLTRAEFDDRATAALTATSQAGLDALTADLKSMKPAQSSEGEVTMMRIEYDALARSESRLRERCSKYTFELGLAVMVSVILFLLLIVSVTAGFR